MGGWEHLSGFLLVRFGCERLEEIGCWVLMGDEENEDVGERDIRLLYS